MTTATLSITGHQFLAGSSLPGTDSASPLRATHAATGEFLPGVFHTPGAEQTDAACQQAAAVSAAFAATLAEARAVFLESIAEELLALGAPLIERAMQESGLPQGRLEGERARTVGQLRLFANELRAGQFLGITIDTPLPDRTPLPRPGLQTMRVPLGPIAVFGASNFPLAFSVAGGDTASAFAAGCPVVVRAHPAHPGTSELAALAISRAVTRCGLPPGVFSMLTGAGNALGEALVTHPAICAVGFTGSRAGGLALHALAQARPTPIPLFAEMSSVNPVFLLPGALEQRGTAIGTDLAASVLLGVGQFCTNPGIVFGIGGPGWNTFAQSAANAFASARPGVMLHAGIARAYAQASLRLSSQRGVTILAQGEAGGIYAGEAQLCATTAAHFFNQPALAEEVFGPSTLLVACDSPEQLLEAATRLEGQLTATLHFEHTDYPLAQALLPILQTKAGRLVANSFPTGVEVCTAMIHGGPFPATTDSRFTSVGSMAIERWLRPVCFQNFPQTLLPAALQTAGEPRRIDGVHRSSAQG